MTFCLVETCRDSGWLCIGNSWLCICICYACLICIFLDLSLFALRSFLRCIQPPKQEHTMWQCNKQRQICKNCQISSVFVVPEAFPKANLRFCFVFPCLLFVLKSIILAIRCQKLQKQHANKCTKQKKRRSNLSQGHFHQLWGWRSRSWGWNHCREKLKTMKKVCEVILLSVGSCEGYQVGVSGVTV